MFNENKKLQIFLHMAAWAIIVFIPQYIINTFGDGNPKSLFILYKHCHLWYLISMSTICTWYLNYF
jgi:hypothetical protein